MSGPVFIIRKYVNIEVLIVACCGLFLFFYTYFINVFVEV